ncbi:hypothetical protein [Altererythrobacter sp. GH1-8]|uniref:hypothetical protein n=1 Tax=Altererythrobacter sp. GH1-8 TaxID=3349333 RepID=UPI00374D3B73
MKLLRSLALSASLAGAMAVSAPAIAQDEGKASENDAMMAEMMAMFAAEPLTPEQEARIPLAAEVINKMIPPGSLSEVMGDMFGMEGMLGPILTKAQEPRVADFAGQLGLEAWELEMNDAAVAEAASIIDPAREERGARKAAVMPEIMTNMMNAMEPAMREAMTEVFAIQFDVKELTDINAFFSTESGAAFARKSMKVSSDPRVLGASMKAMPQMMASFANMEAQMEATTADLPQPRGFADLSAEEQTRMAELTGYSVDELAERAAASAAEEDAAE